MHGVHDTILTEVQARHALHLDAATTTERICLSPSTATSLERMRATVCCGGGEKSHPHTARTQALLLSCHKTAFCEKVAKRRGIST